MNITLLKCTPLYVAAKTSVHRINCFKENIFMTQ